MNQPTKLAFINYLETLAEKQDRGALAAMRRGLGQSPGAAPEMFPYVIPHLPANLGRAQEAAYFLVASLFAWHPLSTDRGNLGDHLAALRSDAGEDALERRFIALLNAHPDDLPDYLRQAVSLLKSNKAPIPINWDQLLRDLWSWDNPDRRTEVQKRWARAFWAPANRPTDPPNP